MRKLLKMFGLMTIKEMESQEHVQELKRQLKRTNELLFETVHSRTEEIKRRVEEEYNEKIASEKAEIERIMKEIEEIENSKIKEQ